MMRVRNGFSAVVLAASMVSGCGGGGSDRPKNTAPSFVGGAPNVQIAENVAGTVFSSTATDPDGQSLIYSLSGSDAEHFVIDGNGVVSLAQPLNYDLPVDANRDNVYQFNISASDGIAVVQIGARVTITNDPEGVTITRFYSVGSDDALVIPRDRRDDLLIAYADGRLVTLDRAGTRSYQLHAIKRGETGKVVGAASIFDQVYVLIELEGVGTVFRFFDFGSYFGRFDTEILSSEIREDVSYSVFVGGSNVFAAIGNQREPDSHDPDGAFGKIYRAYYDPFCGASLASFCFSAGEVGSGIRQPVGGSRLNNSGLLFDRGADAQDEITIFDPSDRQLGFGWPEWEGIVSRVSDPAEQADRPFLAMDRGDGFGESAGIIGGAPYAGSVASLSGKILFADTSGRIRAVPSDFASDGSVHTGTEVEDRTEDFAASGVGVGEIRSIFSAGNSATYIVNTAGDIFIVE